MHFLMISLALGAVLTVGHSLAAPAAAPITNGEVAKRNAADAALNTPGELFRPYDEPGFPTKMKRTTVEEAMEKREDLSDPDIISSFIKTDAYADDVAKADPKEVLGTN